MSNRALLVCGLLGAFSAALCMASSARAAGEKREEQAIKKGDMVKVIKGPAPVKVGYEARTTVEEGAVMAVEGVEGKWVKVTVSKEGEQITGWIDAAKYLSRIEQEATQPSGTSSTRPASAPAPLTDEKLVEALRLFKGKELTVFAFGGLMETEDDAKALMESQEIATKTLGTDTSGRSLLAAAKAVATKHPKCGDIVWSSGAPDGSSVKMDRVKVILGEPRASRREMMPSRDPQNRRDIPIFWQCYGKVEFGAIDSDDLRNEMVLVRVRAKEPQAVPSEGQAALPGTVTRLMALVTTPVGAGDRGDLFMALLGRNGDIFQAVQRVIENHDEAAALSELARVVAEKQDSAKGTGRSLAYSHALWALDCFCDTDQAVTTVRQALQKHCDARVAQKAIAELDEKRRKRAEGTKH